MSVNGPAFCLPQTNHPKRSATSTYTLAAAKVITLPPVGGSKARDAVTSHHLALSFARPVFQSIDFPTEDVRLEPGELHVAMRNIYCWGQQSSPPVAGMVMLMISYGSDYPIPVE